MEEINIFEDSMKLNTSDLDHINKMTNHENSSEVRKFHKYQPERLNPKDSNYYYACLEANDLNTSWDKVFETDSKKEAQEWIDQKRLCRTWHEKIRVCDSLNSTNK